jgi:hypothetical protein
MVEVTQLLKPQSALRERALAERVRALMATAAAQASRRQDAGAPRLRAEHR